MAKIDRIAQVTGLVATAGIFVMALLGGLLIARGHTLPPGVPAVAVLFLAARMAIHARRNAGTGTPR